MRPSSGWQLLAGAHGKEGPAIEGRASTVVSHISFIVALIASSQQVHC